MDVGRGVVAEFDGADRHSWCELMQAFRDANIYQTWSYESVRSNPRNVIRMVLRRGDAVLAAAQARVVRLPGMAAGIAYVRWGPMWRPMRLAEDPAVFRQAVRALREEFSRRRGLVLRLYPLAHRGRDAEVAAILQEEGYRLHGSGGRERTLIIDLRAPLDELRSALDQKWRNCLNRAERSSLELVSGTEEWLFDEVAAMYREMASRKGLDKANDIGHLKRVQHDPPPSTKLRVILARRDGVPCAGAIFGTVGDTGLYVRGATSDAGLKTKASYLVQWAFVQWLKEHGFREYDLNGISPDANPGTYHFKRGLAGRRGSDVEFLGRFQIADNALSSWIVKGGEWLMSRYRRGMSAARALRGPHEAAAGLH
jgi:hypothetical protein